MKTKKLSKMKSAHSFTVLIWSKKHYGKKNKPKSEAQIYNGQVYDNKIKERIGSFHSPAQLLRILEDSYFKAEKKKE